MICDEFVKDLAEIVPFLDGSFRVSVFGNQGDLLPGEVPDFHQSRNCLIGDLVVGVLEVLLHCLIGSSLSFAFQVVVHVHLCGDLALGKGAVLADEFLNEGDPALCELHHGAVVGHGLLAVESALHGRVLAVV